MTARRDDDGAIAILVALMSVVLFGFAALVVDIGDAQTVRSQSQNAVDAAALAGVRELATTGKTPSDAADVVKSYVKDNIGVTDWDGCTDPTPLPVFADSDTADKCISTSPPIGPGVPSYQVRVKLPARHVPSTFGGIFGVSSISISPIAQALSGQPLPPECGPCDPLIDENTTQPTPQSAPTGLPAAIRAMMPDPAAVPPAAPLDPLLGNCPTPGLFAADVHVLTTFHCTMKPGLYVFNNANLDVPADASIASFLSDGSDGLPTGTGATLVFYGSATMTIEGMIGTPVGSSGPPTLIASDPALAATWQSGQPIPGVAIVFDQSDPNAVPPSRSPFTLGDRFGIKGSVYALDGHTTWATAAGDCPAVGSTCSVYDFPNTPSVIATTTTDFAETPPRIPTISTDHPVATPPPSPPHLVK